jgi:hypothetical protein
MLIESLIKKIKNKKIKTYIRVFLVSIDYMNILRSYQSSFFFFLNSTYFWCCIIFSKQAQKTKNRSKLFLKASKIGLLPICG